MDKDTLVKAVMTLFFSMAVTTVVNADDTSTQKTEKCYGVVKAGMNDCATATASCAGSATKDNQPDAFIFTPTGLCQKLVGGHLNAEK